MGAAVLAQTWVVLLVVATLLLAVHEGVAWHASTNARSLGHAIFPSSHAPAFQTPYRVLKVAVEQQHAPTLALLVSTVRRQRYQLWSALPYALSPPPVPVYDSDVPFDFAANDDVDVVVVAQAHQVAVLRQSALSRGTLGSWKVKHVEATGGAATDPVPTVTLAQDGAVGLVRLVDGLWTLQRQAAGTYVWAPASLDRVPLDFALGPRSLLRDLWVLGVPDHRELDGLVEVYRCEPGGDGADWTWQQTLPPPVRGGYFGAQVVGAVGPTGVAQLVVSAPFADRGTGAVYLYAWEAGRWARVQTLPGVGAANGAWGQALAVSAHGRFLAVATRHQLYRFEWDAAVKRYGAPEGYAPCAEPVQGVHVDQAGNLLYVTATSVGVPVPVTRVALN